MYVFRLSQTCGDQNFSSYSRGQITGHVHFTYVLDNDVRSDICIACAFSREDLLPAGPQVHLVNHKLSGFYRPLE